MTIKAIKEQYKNYGCEYGGHNSFVVYDFKDGNGKCVIIVNNEGIYRYKDVIQVVRVRDGEKLLSEGRCRPCDNLYDDAIDVAMEMLWDEEIR
jgi:hypothetical protein